MYVFRIEATNKSLKWLKKNKIDIKALSAALSLLVSEAYPSVKIRPIVLKLQIDFTKDESRYVFRTNKIYLCHIPYTDINSYKKQRREIFDHFLHEFRHWMQSQIYKCGVRQIAYTDEDANNNTNAYYRNKLEVDARQFVRQYLTKLINYYKHFSQQ